MMDADLAPALPANTETLAFRQLRHQTKNALQRLICEIARHAELQSTDEGKLAIADVERRICLMARVSDALFGFTACPDSIERRLRALGDSMIGLLGANGQTIDCEVRVEGTALAMAADTILRIAHEMIGNSIKHGLSERAEGRITIRLSSTGQRTTLQVIDDGAGPRESSSPGEGSALMRELAAVLGGRISLSRDGNRTVSQLDMPNTQHPDFAMLQDAS